MIIVVFSLLSGKVISYYNIKNLKYVHFFIWQFIVESIILYSSKNKFVMFFIQKIYYQTKEYILNTGNNTPIII